MPESFVDLRSEMAVIARGEERILRFDGEGRLFLAQEGGFSFRRGFDGRIRKRPRAVRFRERTSKAQWLDGHQAEDFLVRSHETALRSLEEALRGDLPFLKNTAAEEAVEWKKRIASWTPRRYADSASEFRRLYGSIPVLPPDQYYAVYLQVVFGCSYNRCSFCTLYADRSFRVRTMEEWRRHLEEVKRFFGRGLFLRRSYFLGDANGLAMEQEEILTRLAMARESLPALRDGFHAFHDTFSGKERTAEEYKALRNAGLRRIYIGVESGCDELRRRMAKPGSAEAVRRRVLLAKKGGLAVGLMILLGIGGEEFSDRHVEETRNLLDSLSLSKEDIVFLSPLFVGEREEVLPGVPAPPSLERVIRREEKCFRDSLSGPRISRYDVEQFVY